MAEAAAGGTINYTYDALDRVATRNGTPFAYAGKEIDPVADGEFEYSRSPSGDLLALDDTWNPDPALLAGRDRHGDLTDLFTADGALTDTMSYDPFGDSASEAGYTDPNVGFQSDWTDPASEDVWMGARWYAPELDTFLSRDSIPEKLDTPFSLNRYTYAAGDPLDYYDPDGHWPRRLPRWRPPVKPKINWAALAKWVNHSVRRPAPRGKAWAGIVLSRAHRSPAPRTEPGKVKLPCSAAALDCTARDFRNMNRRQQVQYGRDFNRAFGKQHNITAGVKSIITQTKKTDSKGARIKNAAVLEGLQGGMYLTKNPGATSTPGRKGIAAGSRKFERYVDHQVGLIGKTPTRADRKRSKEILGNATETATAAGGKAATQMLLGSLPFGKGGGGIDIGFSPRDALGIAADAVNSGDRWVMDTAAPVAANVAKTALTAQMCGACLLAQHGSFYATGCLVICAGVAGGRGSFGGLFGGLGSSSCRSQGRSSARASLETGGA